MGKGIEDLTKRVNELKDSKEWNSIPEYNKPDLDKDSISVIESKLKAIDEAKEQKAEEDKVISKAQTTADQILEAKAKTEQLNQAIESSTKPPVEETKQPQETMNNFISNQKKSQDNMMQQAAISQAPSPLVDSEQVNQLIQEQQKTNSLLEQLIQAIMTSGQSIQASIMQGATSNQDPFSVANAISSPRRQQGSQYGVGALSMNNNKNNILDFLNNTRDPRR